MGVGRDDSFLLIEKLRPDDPYSPWRLEVLAPGAGQRFSAVHDRVVLDTSENARQQFAAFDAVVTQRLEIPLTEGGVLPLERDSRGYITVHCRLGGWKAHAALEGVTVVEGEFTGGFCREFGALLRGAN
jgi:hypothetical protein